ncbi:MAG: NADH:ubiquinone oxidoreductase subunit NDUFA12 [Rhodospirillaceae bacterium]|nr:NADH:ubiquinone oxidoreductase subunit NDUFA12 [Rhodospirillaceae bacterium]
MTIGTRLLTWFEGELVGSDSLGNIYYRSRRSRRNGREKRWVIYKGQAEASMVPPEWNGWLRHTFAEPPLGDRLVHAWQKPHQPNLTGTPQAYRPPGHLLAGGQRQKATGDYEPWRPV